MQLVNSYARRFENRSSILTQIEYNDALAKRNANKQTSSSVSDSTTGKTDSADTGSTAVNALIIASVTPVTADLDKRHHRWDMSDIRIHNDRYLIPGKQVCNRMVLV